MKSRIEEQNGKVINRNVTSNRIKKNMELNENNLENESKVKSKVRFFNVFQIIACLFDLTAISKKIAVFVHKY